MTPGLGKTKLEFSWRQNGANRRITLDGDFSGTDVVRIVAETVNSYQPDGWLDGYAAGRKEGVNATRLEYAEKQKGGKK